jgi:two-component system, NtrC family, nitrogen regulation sensor histidine kinase NtrY
MESEAVNDSRSNTANVLTRTASPRTRPRPTPRRHLSYENRILWLTLGSGALATVIAIILLWIGDYSSNTRWSLGLIMLVVWLGFAFAARSSVIRPLQTLTNMQCALREGDFSFRVRGANAGDTLGELMLEVNTLAETLRAQRLGAMEANALLTVVMNEIDVAVFAFDGERRMRLVNRAGERLMAQNAERLLGKTAEDLGLQECLEGESARTLEKTFPGQSGRWGVRRSEFRQEGKRHYLLVLADLSRALREEERQAWQRLVRVLGHELNNSLTPISSIATSLEDSLRQESRAEDWEDDLRRGLGIIAERSAALSRFMRDYSRLTRLPRPQLRAVQLSELVGTAVGLELRMSVQVKPGPELTLNADPDQLQQVLINLIRNAVDATQPHSGNVMVSWDTNGSWLSLTVEDEGNGIANPANLFVPFFTTKPGGSGIGLVLSRQIAELHGGSLSLRNRSDHTGCEALLQLPLGN